jgi:predicted nucleotidyltransferase
VPDKVNEVVYYFFKQIKKLFGEHLSKVILYGSYARGDYKNNSDVDIMIYVDIV